MTKQRMIRVVVMVGWLGAAALGVRGAELPGKWGEDVPVSKTAREWFVSPIGTEKG